MFELARIALVAEGPTDRVVIEAALRRVLAPRRFVLVQLQPEESLAFGPIGAGWAGVYRWCKQAARRGDGRLSTDKLMMFDLLIIQLDADVAARTYGAASIFPEPSDAVLPCACPCPPASDSADALRRVVLSWCGEASTPPRTVLCVPSNSMEAWVVALLFPEDKAVLLGPEFECVASPESRLAQQPKRRRIKKSPQDYDGRRKEMELGWHRISGSAALSQAKRFEDDVLASLNA